MHVIEHITAAIRATSFVGEHSFAWFGKRPADLAPALRRRLSPEALRYHRDATLCDQLYRNFYCRGYARPIRWDRHEARAAGSNAFVGALAAANRGRGYRSTGWRVLVLERPRAVITRGGLTVTTFLQELFAEGGGSIETGSVVSLALPAGEPNASPGYYMAVSDTDFLAPDLPLIRLYWNISVEGAVPLMRKATEALNSIGTAFRLKLINSPPGYNRCDSAVLYVAGAEFDRLAGTLGEIHHRVRPFLGSYVPVFTKMLAPGLGLAEDPPGGDSFGVNRCFLLTAGLTAAHDAQHTALEPRFDAVRASFDEAGISLDTPHLNPGSVDRYAPLVRLRLPSRAQSGSARGAKALHESLPGTADTVDRIARALCDGAIWHDGLCTWVAPAAGDPDAGVVRALGSDLYAGLSGVALFLAEAARLTGCSASHATAVAALRQAEKLLPGIPPRQRAALFTGWTGVAAACAHVGQCLADAETEARAQRIADASLSTLDAQIDRDLLSGSAGAILGLLFLGEHFGQNRFIDAAVGLGDRLLAEALSSRDGVSWHTINSVREYRLTGLSHGAAGIALALLRLSAATGHHRFRRVAEAALAYEQRWFDAERGNWPDLREARPVGSRSQPAMAFSTYWCHGAPGIALSRVAAFDVTGNPDYRAQASAAFETTLDSIRDAPRLRIEDCLLCHSTIGNADIALTVTRWKADYEGTGLDLIGAVASGVSQTLTSWRGSISPGADPHPGLMIGLAGAGWYLLRLSDPLLPSILNCMVVDRGSPTQTVCETYRLGDHVVEK